jgi:FkbM family methyltransferase
MLSRLVGADGLVYTFEPDINSLLRLAHNIKINSITNVAILPYAVSHEIKISSWFTDSSQPWNSHLIDPVEFTDSSALSVYPIVTISLDALQDAIPFAHIALVKIDVEGKEADVLRGASKLFAQTRPLALIELHSKEVSDQAFEILRDYDYRWQTIEYQSETRHHIFAFPEETRQEFEILIAKFLAEHSRTVS